ncbi:hypothetical protein WR25_21581 [Diploscapter pachys]|uniref:Uncharacterized protein n=1 Tax=Diploscapter pachys TaxID=2018661 RepID=A0A2A2M2J5_9BILA|nr:hypothetical protein WR25_21581 [Diploscapter pachys]
MRRRCYDAVGGSLAEAQVDQADRAAGAGRRFEDMRGLEGAERKTERRGMCRGPIGHGARVGIDAAGQIGGDHDPRCTGKAGERCVGGGGQRSRQPRAEQAVDQDRRGPCRVQRLDIALPAPACGGGGGRPRGFIRRDSYAQAETLQNRCGNIAVAAVVAGSAEHEHIGACSQTAHGSGNAFACALHQRLDGNARRDGGVFRSAHLRCAIATDRHLDQLRIDDRHVRRLRPIGRNNAAAILRDEQAVKTTIVVADGEDQSAIHPRPFHRAGPMERIAAVRAEDQVCVVGSSTLNTFRVGQRLITSRVDTTIAAGGKEKQGGCRHHPARHQRAIRYPHRRGVRPLRRGG